MNKPIAIVFVLNSLALIAHLTVGTKESLSIKPTKHAADNLDLGFLHRLDRNWKQTMCAFQMLSVDLSLMSVVLYLLAFTQYLSPARLIGLVVAALYFLWAIAWLVQLASVRDSLKDFLFLGQWILWLVCSSLVWWGSQSL